MNQSGTPNAIAWRKVADVLHALWLEYRLHTSMLR
jgi:hypothetical protein